MECCEPNTRFPSVSLEVYLETREMPSKVEEEIKESNEKTTYYKCTRVSSLSTKMF
jgi:hypothetical protein